MAAVWNMTHDTFSTRICYNPGPGKDFGLLNKTVPGSKNILFSADPETRLHWFVPVCLCNVRIIDVLHLSLGLLNSPMLL